MNGIFLRWGIPAFLTVIGGTAAAIATSGAAIPPDLTSRTASNLADPQYSWASVTFDMRDAVVTGTATTQKMIDDVVARVAAEHGVRSVTSRVVLAEFVSPFPFSAKVEAGKMSLSGGLPDEAARAELLSLAGEGAGDNLRLMSGAPARADWLAAAKLAIEQAAQFDQGEAKLADLALSVTGRAKNPTAYNVLSDFAGAQLPPGVSVAERQVVPALADPFVWHAAYDGHTVALSGFTPDSNWTDLLTASVPAGMPVSNSVVLASGAPPSFQESATLLLQNLLKLEQGTADISGDTLSLTGAPATAEVGQDVRVAMTPSKAELTLDAPRVPDYWLSAEKASGHVTVDGFVPDAGMRDRLEAMDQVDATGLELGRGAPERFESGVDFLLQSLNHMSEGRGSIKGTVISIEGRASTVADFSLVETTLNLGAPQGLILGDISVKPPLATPFTFAAEKAADGTFRFSGYVPSDTIRKALHSAIASDASDTMTIADGNPPDFDTLVLKALSVLPLLDSGRIAYDGTSWSLSGAVDSPQKAFTAESAFRTAGLRAAGWSYEVTLPAAKQEAALPVIDPYVWRAQKAADGTVTFAGFVPTPQLKRYLAGHTGGKVVDSSNLGSGAPDGFIPAVMAGLDALVGMDSGSLGLSAGNWSLTGEVASADQRRQIEKTLAAALDVSSWHIGLQVAGAAPVVSPFSWSASKAADGSYTLKGYVPTEELRRFVAVRAGKVAKDATLVGSGEPDGFVPDVLAGLDALAKLEMGTVQFEGGGWSISGKPLTQADADAVSVALAAGSQKGANWTRALEAPEPIQQPAAELPPLTPAEPADVPAPDTDADIATPPTPAEVTTPAEPPVVAELPVPSETPVPEVAHTFVFEGKKALGESISFSGAVPAEPMRRYLAVISGTEPNEGLAISTGLPGDFIVSANAATRALALLAKGDFGLDGSTWVFKGEAASEGDRQAALSALAVVPNAAQWQTSVTLLPPLEICQQRVGAFAARNAILFQSGSALIAEQSHSALDELAADLALCPTATVNVEGHTDADGEAEANLALSVSRAEAVVDALILRGVGPERLYAIGYGESLPIASNDTKAGKQANRRIAFTLDDGQQ